MSDTNAAEAISAAGFARSATDGARPGTTATEGELPDPQVWPANARIGMDARVISMNDVMASWLGLEPAEVVGMSATEVWPPEDMQAELAGITRVVNGDQDSFEVDRLIYGADGVPHQGRLRVKLVRATQGERDHLLVNCRLLEDDRAAVRVATHADAWGLPTEAIPIGLILLSLTGHPTWVNPAACRILAAPAPELKRVDTTVITHPDDKTYDVACGLRALQGEIDRWIFEKRMRRGDGEWIWVLQETTLVRDENGRPDHFLCQIIDVTSRRRAEEALRTSRERIEELTTQLPIGIIETDGDGIIIRANPALQEIAGRDPVAEGLRSFQLIHEDDHDHVAKVFFSSFTTHDDWEVDFRVVRPDGSWRWVKSIGRTRFADDDETMLGVVSTWQDTTDEVLARQSSTRFAELLNQIPDPVSIIDGDLGLVYVNPPARELLGIDPQEQEQFPQLDHVLLPESLDELANVGIVAARDEGRWTGELSVNAADGTIHTLLISLTSERDPETGLEFITSIGRDITDMKAEQRALTEQATRDPLTGVANRSLLYRQLDLVLGAAAASRPSESIGDPPIPALLFVDLDWFKAINDAHGHQVGDAVLVEVAGRLLANVRASDTVARFGGDEFVVICRECNGVGEATALAERLREAVGAPYEIGGQQLRIGASIGVAMAADSTTPASLIRQADQAAYQAKAGGRNQVALADDDPSTTPAVPGADPGRASLSDTNPPDSSIGGTSSEEQPWEGRA